MKRIPKRMLSALLAMVAVMGLTMYATASNLTKANNVPEIVAVAATTKKVATTTKKAASTTKKATTTTKKAATTTKKAATTTKKAATTTKKAATTTKKAATTTKKATTTTKKATTTTKKATTTTKKSSSGLSKRDQAFFDMFKGSITSFKDPASVKLVEVNNVVTPGWNSGKTYYTAKISAKNSYGGVTSTTYLVTSSGLIDPNNLNNLSIAQKQDRVAQLEAVIAYLQDPNQTHYSFDLKALNKAIQDYLASKGLL